jgi:predicted metal-dependent hydrolase
MREIAKTHIQMSFWTELDKVILDYLEQKEWLKRNGVAMDV